VTNTPPKFIQTIPPLIEINNLEPKIIILPQVIDEEYNNWGMKVYDSANSKLPEFLDAQAGVLRIAPLQRHIGKHSITIDLIDEFSAKFSYSFYI
jgi:hypothetical protein